MLQATKGLNGFHLETTDGRVGSVDNMYFDDEDWTIRYLVVSTGSWLSGRSVLISPHSLGKPDRVRKAIPTSLSRGQIKSAPGLETDKPVSRQFERDYYDYFGYPYYWQGPYIWGGAAFPYYAPPVGIPEQPAVLPDQGRRTARERDTGEGGDPHLRSAESWPGL